MLIVVLSVIYIVVHFEEIYWSTGARQNEWTAEQRAEDEAKQARERENAEKERKAREDAVKRERLAAAQRKQEALEAKREQEARAKREQEILEENRKLAADEKARKIAAEEKLKKLKEDTARLEKRQSQNGTGDYSFDFITTKKRCPESTVERISDYVLSELDYNFWETGQANKSRVNKVNRFVENQCKNSKNSSDYTAQEL